MNIIELKAENFKRLEAVSISPEQVNIISGKNAQGKSSVLDAIEFCLTGPSKDIPRPIREGESKAKIEIDLGEITVTRVITPSGARLQVTAKDGTQMKSPQAVLDKLFSAVSFDPVRFLNMSERDQIETLLKATGRADRIAELEREKTEAYNERRAVNRLISELEAKLKDFQPGLKPDEEEISVENLWAQLREANEHNAGVNTLKVAMSELGNRGKQNAQAFAENISRIGALQEEIKKLEEMNVAIQADLQEMREQYVAIAEKIEKDGLKDIELISQRLQGVEQHNTQVKARKQAQEQFDKLNALKAESEDYTNKISEIEEEKQKLLTDNPIGIPLDLSEDGILFGGVPLKQCSSAEQLKISMAVAMALQPNLKVILIREGSLLDSEGLETIKKFAAKNDYQLWIEKVDETGSVGIVIEEGRVKNA